MAKNKTIHNVLNYFIAAVWLANGLLCKVLDLVPRHEQIVAAILGNKNPQLLTKVIGFLEILMAIWILTGYKSRLNALTQIIIIAIMNTLEFVLVPGLLLFGKVNAILALALILVIYFNQFILNTSAKRNEHIIIP